MPLCQVAQEENNDDLLKQFKQMNMMKQLLPLLTLLLVFCFHVQAWDRSGSVREGTSDLSLYGVLSSARLL
jgi:hypothetical protein